MNKPDSSIERPMSILKKCGNSIAWPEFLGLLALMVAVWLLWNTQVIYPLKILVVFFHELSHGLAALITGGRIVEIHLTAAEGGLCITEGGSRFLILTAGYLGSLAFGGTILMLAAKTKRDRWISRALGAIVLIVCLIWVRPVLGFGFLFAAIAGLALLVTGHYLPAHTNDLLNKTIGLTSCLYAVMDIKSDILDRPGLPSDATQLAEQTGIPGTLWGVAWIAVALALGLFFLAIATSRSGQAAPRGPDRETGGTA